ncbi:MAG: extracellular matrix regulator RemB [Dethiobacteria bacterium]
MFLHIGNSRVVSLEELIGIFNLEIKNNQVNTQFLESNYRDNNNQKEEKTANSFVITRKKIYYSSISPLTLQKRIEKNWE